MPTHDTIDASSTPLLGVYEVAVLLNVSPRTIWRWVRAGRLRATRLSPKIVRFRPMDVERLIPDHFQAIRAAMSFPRSTTACTGIGHASGPRTTPHPATTGDPPPARRSSRAHLIA